MPLGTEWLGHWFGCYTPCPAAYTREMTYAFPTTSTLCLIVALLSSVFCAIVFRKLSDTVSSREVATAISDEHLSTRIPNCPWGLFFAFVGLTHITTFVTLAFVPHYSFGTVRALGGGVWVLHGITTMCSAWALHFHHARYGRHRTDVRDDGSVLLNDDHSSGLIPQPQPQPCHRVLLSPFGAIIAACAVYIAAGFHTEMMQTDDHTVSCHSHEKNQIGVYWLFILCVLLQQVPVYFFAVKIVREQDPEGRTTTGPGRGACIVLSLSLLLELPSLFPNSLWSDFIVPTVSTDLCVMSVLSGHDIVLLLRIAGVVLRFVFVRLEYRRNRERVVLSLYQHCTDHLDQLHHF